MESRTNMKHKFLKVRPTALAVAAGLVLVAASSSSRAADETHSTRLAPEVAGSVLVAGQPIAGATVTLYTAGFSTPTKLAEGQTDDQGLFRLDARQAPADGVLYVVAKGGTPKSA